MPLHAEVTEQGDIERDETEVVIYEDGVRAAKMIFTHPEGQELQGWLITSEDSPIEWSMFADRRRSERPDVRTEDGAADRRRPIVSA